MAKVLLKGVFNLLYCPFSQFSWKLIKNDIADLKFTKFNYYKDALLVFQAYFYFIHLFIFIKSIDLKIMRVYSHLLYNQ